MKTKLAIALSVAGVLGAGSVAALVNTQILDGGADTDTALAAPAATVPAAAPGTTGIDSAATTPSTTSISTTSTTVAGRLTTFQVGDAGSVTVDLVDGRLVVPNAEPATGWALASIDDTSDDGEIDVSFASQSTVVDFAVALVGDQFVPRVSATAVTSTTVTSTTWPTTSVATVTVADTVANTAGAPTTSIDDDDFDDDDHDDHDDDEFDDDHSGRGGGGDDDDHDDDDHGGDDD